MVAGRGAVTEKPGQTPRCPGRAGRPARHSINPTAAAATRWHTWAACGHTEDPWLPGNGVSAGERKKQSPHEKRGTAEGSVLGLEGQGSPER